MRGNVTDGEYGGANVVIDEVRNINVRVWGLGSGIWRVYGASRGHEGLVRLVEVEQNMNAIMSDRNETKVRLWDLGCIRGCSIDTGVWQLPWEKDENAIDSLWSDSTLRVRTVGVGVCADELRGQGVD